MTDNTQPEAGSTHIIRYALEMGLLWIDGDGRDKVREALDALDTLETQLEAIGAGGVTGPLIGQPQAMPDLSALTERGAKAWAGVDAQGLREGFTAADMATASAQWFRDGVASLAASAGSEPVAGMNEYGVRGYLAATLKCWHRLTGDEAAELVAMTQRLSGLYTHPSPPEGMVGGWITLPGALPEPGTPVLLDIGKKYPIRAMWAAKYTVQAADDDTDWGEYVEADDMYYAPEGWYEWNECEDNHWRVTETPRAWMPLPPTNPAGSGKGE